MEVTWDTGGSFIFKEPLEHKSNIQKHVVFFYSMSSFCKLTALGCNIDTNSLFKGHSFFISNKMR